MIGEKNLKQKILWHCPLFTKGDKDQDAGPHEFVTQLVASLKR